MEDKMLLERFIDDLEKMEPTWKAWSLTLTCGISIRRETGELVRMFRMWDERFWNVYVFVEKVDGVRYRDKAHNFLSLKQAVSLVQKYIKQINNRNNQEVLKKTVVLD